jgi:hypothetical protein
MNKNVILMAAFITLFSLLFSCGQEMFEQNAEKEISIVNETLGVQTYSQGNVPNFEIVNGHLKFESESDYIAVYNSLSDKNKRELIAWSETNSYTSLLSWYRNVDSIAYSTFVPDHDYEPGEDFIDKSERISDPQLATLFNNDGIVLVGDTIFKLRGKYIYKILNGDSANAEEIDNATDIASLEYIPHFQHTIKLQSRLRNENRSNVISVTSKRREFVEFHHEISEIALGVIRFRAWMSGQAQTKTLFWWPNFDDEIVSGTITNDVFGIVRPTTGNSVNYIPICYNSRSGYDVVNIEVTPFDYTILSAYRFTVTFKFVKNTKKGEEVYTRDYFSNT